MNPLPHDSKIEDRFLTRRQLLCRGGMGLGALAFADLMGQAGALWAKDDFSTRPFAPQPTSWA